ncbi:putative transcriptional regulator, TetR family protein [Dietzia sp. NCCP-2495]|uniref:TetR/AcrR family transcriptional regulator n=1 Tax=Dietzia sp. NCCP-2495 TaxID=2934675 RepID=UPI002232B988|nr:TetR/AcrR family transcriptional regulator [Dietzia sp. NCCP-2495]GLB63080.1 putative transcriptional regulator, TetR family protein [Dietzia sp. NCCP-2495]
MARSDVVREYGGVSADDRRAERRRRLLAAGRQVWGTSGLGEVTVRGVCSAAGLQPRYFYEHFTDRGALVGAVADEVRTELFTTLVESSVEVDGGRDGGLGERLRAALAAFFGIIAADPRIHRIMSTDLAGVPGLEQRRLESLNLVADLILEHGGVGQAPRGGHGASGPVPAAGIDSRSAALFVAGGVNHLLDNWLVAPEGSPQELADLCTRLCLRMVRDEQAPPQ